VCVLPLPLHTRLSGASGARHSLRPLAFEGQMSRHTSGVVRRGSERAWLFEIHIIGDIDCAVAGSRRNEVRPHQGENQGSSRCKNGMRARIHPGHMVRDAAPSASGGLLTMRVWQDLHPRGARSSRVSKDEGRRDRILSASAPGSCRRRVRRCGRYRPHRSQNASAPHRAAPAADDTSRDNGCRRRQRRSRMRRRG